MSQPLIQSYEMKLSSPECSPGSDWYRAFIHVENDIAGVFPYLNAELKGRLDYNHKASVLLWESDNQKRYAFRPQEIAIAPIVSREEAQELTDGIIDIVNDVWNRRDQIQPRFEGKKALPNVLDILKILPRTNCKECGSPTCMAFAAVLRNDSTQLPRCRYLPEGAYLKLVS